MGKHKVLSQYTHKYKTTFTSTTTIVLRFSNATLDTDKYHATLVERNTWQLQFPIAEQPVCCVSLSQIKSTNNPNNLFRYCPVWVSSQQGGAPLRRVRGGKSGIETAMNNKREVKSATSGYTVRFVESTTTLQRTAGRTPSMHIAP
jgi:hypothetical protein